MEEKEMKKVTAILLAALGICMLAGCNGTSFVYPNADRYTVGNADITRTVENLEIDWASGSVTVEPGDKCSIREECDPNVAEDGKVHWWLDGTTLRVKYCASGTAAVLQLHEKTLTVTLPVENLKSVTVNTASGNVTAEGMKTGSLNIATASGSIRTVCEAGEIELTCASGKIGLEQKGNCSSAKLTTASGSIKADCENTTELKANSASGKITVNGKVTGELEAEVVSGGVECDLDLVPPVCKLVSTSGGVELKLPKNAGFTAKVDTVSGDFSSDFFLKKEGKSYIAGDGSAKLTMSSTSGDIVLEGK